MKRTLNYYYTTLLSQYLNNAFYRSQNIKLYNCYIMYCYKKEYVKHSHMSFQKILLWKIFQLLLSNKITIYGECVNSISNPVFRLSSIIDVHVKLCTNATYITFTIRNNSIYVCIKLRDVLLGLAPFSITQGKPRRVVLWESNYENIDSVNL